MSNKLPIRGRFFVMVTSIALTYVVIRCVLAATNAPALYSDTVRYWQPEAPWSVFHQWTGSMAPSLLPQLLFLLPLRLADAVQGLIGGIAWGFAAWCAMLGARFRVVGAICGAAIMLIGLLPYNAGFDSSVLSESLSISSSLACITLIFLWCAPQVRAELGISQQVCLLGIAGAYALSVVSRPSGALLLLPCIAAAALFRARSLWIPAAAAALTIVLAVSVWGVAAARHETDRAGWYAAANRLGARISPAYLAEAREAGLPYCNGLGERLLATPDLSDRLNLAKSKPCPELQDWLDAGGLSVVKQVRGLPAETLRAWRSENYAQWQPVIFREMDYPLIQWPEFLGKDFYVLNRWYYDAYTRVLIMLTGASLIILVASAWVPRLSAGGVRALSGLFLVFVVAIVGYSFVTWVLDTYETRHFLPVQAVAPVISILAPLFVAREAVGSRSEV